MKSQSTKSKDKKKNEWASWNITTKMWYYTNWKNTVICCDWFQKKIQRRATHHHVLYVVGTHPSPSGHGSERRVQAVHMEQERTVITLDQRSHPAAPVEEEERENLMHCATTLTTMWFHLGFTSISRFTFSNVSTSTLRFSRNNKVFPSNKCLNLQKWFLS